MDFLGKPLGINQRQVGVCVSVEELIPGTMFKLLPAFVFGARVSLLPQQRHSASPPRVAHSLSTLTEA